MTLSSRKQEEFESLCDLFEQQLPERLSAILASWGQFRQTPMDARVQSRFIQAVHGLAGAAGCFGFARVGEIAKDIEAKTQKSIRSGELTKPDCDALDVMLCKLSMVSREGSDLSGTA